MNVILVTGAYGQLGNELKALSPHYAGLKFLFTDVDTLDLTQPTDLEAFFQSNSIEYIINCAAYTAVDKAESEPELAEAINVTAVKNIADIAGKYNSKVIHISTDYIFDGTSCVPYSENDTPNPVSVYGSSKLKGEAELLKCKPDAMIIRTAWLYSVYGNNFVKTMRRLGAERSELNVVFDQVGSPTYAHDLAKAVIDIISLCNTDPGMFKPGIYHYSNEGVCSWYDFAIEVLRFSGIRCTVKPIMTAEYPTPAKRPCYGVLNKEKIKKTFNLSIPYWKDSLEKCIRKIEG